MTTLSLKPILREAWAKVAGSKKFFFSVFFVLAVLQLFLYALQVTIGDEVTRKTGVDILLNLVLLFLCAPFIAGFVMLGVRRARGETLHIKDGFIYFKKMIPLFFVQIMTLVTLWFVMCGLAFGVMGALGGAYELGKVFLAVSGGVLGLVVVSLLLALISLFSFTFILVADQNKSPWQAYKGSIKMAFPHLKVLWLAEIVFILFDILGAIPGGIGLLWTLPFSYIATGIFYREILAFQCV